MTPEIFSQNLLNPWVLLLIIAWILPWKGVALWKAVKNGQKKWFIALLILNTFAILEIVYIFYFSKNPKSKIQMPNQAQNPKSKTF